jgi:hypothetical protein
MLNRSKLAAVGLLAAVFVAGGLAGWGGHEAAEREDHGLRGGRGGPDALVSMLSRELALSAPQRDSVRAIIVRHGPEIDSLRARVRPQFDSIKARMRAEIDAQLTPEQRAKHQQLIDQAEHHRREREGGGGAQGDSSKTTSDRRQN